MFERVRMAFVCPQLTKKGGDAQRGTHSMEEPGFCASFDLA